MIRLGSRLRFRYSWRLFVGDAAGGAIASLIALPYGLAMASLMGLPPVLGVMTSILTAPITAVLGRNPVLIGGTASATVPFIEHAVRQQGVGGAAKVCIAAAVIMMAFCVLRLGRHIAKVPHAVVSGFSCGVGAMMVISQLKTILGLSTPVDASASMAWQFARVASHLGETRGAPLAMAAIVVLVAYLAARRAPRAPAPLLGVVAATAAAAVFGWREKVVGALPLELPPLVGFSWAPGDARAVLPSAFGLAFVSSVNILITSRVVEHFRGRHKHMKKSDADAELGAYGIANVCAGMFGAPMSVGIPARSLANLRCGGTTRVSNLVHGALLVAMLVAGAGPIARVPMAALAGVTAYVGLCLLDWSAWRRLPRMRRVDAGAFLATAAAVLCVNAVAAVAVGCSLYGVRELLLRLPSPRAARPLPVAAGEGRRAIE